MSPSRLVRRLATIFAIFGFWALPSMAQGPTTVSDINASGAKPFSSLSGNDIEYVDVNNGGVNVKIPLVSKKGRGGLDFNLNITYSSKFWDVVNDPTYGGHLTLMQDGRGSTGWDTDFLNLISSYATIVCYDPNNPDQYELGFVFHDGDGAKHSFQNQTPVSCASGYPRDYSTDMTGLMLKTPTYLSQPSSPHTLYLPNGVRYIFKFFTGVGGSTFAYIPDIEDTNGNRITSSYVSGAPNGTDTETWTDSSGAIVAVRKFYPSGGPVTSVSYTDSNGNLQTYTFTWTSTPIVCNFQHPQPCIWTNGGIIALSQITLPNGLSYRFGYKDTSGSPNPGGELMRIDLPSGGYTRYEYQTLPNGVNSPDNGPADTRVVTKRVHSADGVHEDAWLYSYTRGTQNTTTVTDPLGNQEIYTFDSLNSYAQTQFFETHHKFFQGSATLIKQIDQSYQYDTVSCLNFFPSCGGTGNVNHRVISRTVTWPQTNQVSQTTYAYDQFSFDRGTLSRGNVIQTQEYDYGSGSPGALLRTTVSSPLTTNPVNSVDYTGDNFHIWRKPSSNVVHSGATNGPIVAQTQFEYDNYTQSISASGATQHDSAFGTGYTTRGNTTAIQRWRNTDGSWLTTRNQFDDAGNVISTKDPIGNVTQFDYTDSWGNSACAPSGQTKAYPTTVTNALTQLTKSTFNSCTGSLASARDQNDINGNRAGTTFSYDLLGRTTSVSLPDGGQTTNCYTDVGGSTCAQGPAPFSFVTTKKLNASTNLTSTTLYDGLGRPTQTQLNSDPDGVTSTATTYDALGRQYQTYNPTRCSPPTSNCSESTWGVTTNFYDVLGRTCLVVPPDGSLPTGGACPTTQPVNTVFTTYSGNCATVTDPAGKARKSCSDGLGRLTQVTEDPGGLGYVTTYGYDALGNLLNVVQNGSRPRSFVYDSLSRLTSATNPESGTITYSYDANGNLTSKTSPAPNQTGSATVTLSYCYDALNRMTFKNYTSPCSSLTPPPCGSTAFPSASAFFVYDCNQIDSDTALQNLVGRLVMSSQTIVSGPNPYFGNTWLDYDPMGRVQHLAQCARYNCGPYGSNPGWWIVTNTYNLAGDLASYTDASGNILTQSFDGAGRPSQLTSSWSDSTHPATLLTVDSSIGFWPNGTLRKAALGNGLTQASFLNNRLQPCRLVTNFAATLPASCTDSNQADILDFTYCYGLPYQSTCSGTSSSTANNGNLSNWNATGQQTFSRSFAYDSLNRLSKMTETNGAIETCKPASSSSNLYTVNWTIDAWGNLTVQNPSSVQQPNNNPVCSISQSVGTNNQLGGFSYDAAGNMTSDGSNFYFYDSENRLAEVYPLSYAYQGTTPPSCSSANVSCYFYNAEGQRIAKYQGDGGVNGGVNTTFYIYGTDGEVVADTDVNLNWNETYIHFAGQFVAQYRGSYTGFIVKDHLGSTRLDTVFVPTGGTPPSGCTVPSGATYCVYDNMDYLPFGQQIAGSSSVTHKFTGKERDHESGLDEFGARYYSSSLGRFTIPDWAANAVDVPYADFGNPQSLNLYSYVKNNPLNTADPDGHCCLDWIKTHGKDIAVGVAKTVFNSLAPGSVPLFDLWQGGQGPNRADIPRAQPANSTEAVTMVATTTVVVTATVIAPETESASLNETLSTTDTLQGLANQAVDSVGSGSGATYGTLVHSEFSDLVEGLGNPNLSTEVSYNGRKVVPYGTSGSVRLDAVEGPLDAPTRVYDLKTGNAKLTPKRINQIQDNIPGGSNVPVTEIKPQ